MGQLHQFGYSDEELLKSINRLGPLLPGLKFEGDLLDGRRRRVICLASGLKEPPTRTFRTWQEAAQALFALHPERAIEFARRHMVNPVPRRIAEALEVRAASIALYFATPQPKRSDGLWQRHKRTLAHLRAYLERVEQGIEPLETTSLRRLIGNP